jgi:hypothetical protein
MMPRCKLIGTSLTLVSEFVGRDGDRYLNEPGISVMDEVLILKLSSIQPALRQRYVGTQGAQRDSLWTPP